MSNESVLKVISENRLKASYSDIMLTHKPNKLHNLIIPIPHVSFYLFFVLNTKMYGFGKTIVAVNAFENLLQIQNGISILTRTNYNKIQIGIRKHFGKPIIYVNY